MRDLGLNDNTSGIVIIGGGAPVPREDYGELAERLHGLAVQGFPVPKSIAISMAQFGSIWNGDSSSLEKVAAHFSSQELLEVRPSPEARILNGVPTFFNVGMSSAACKLIAKKVGDYIAKTIHGEFIHTFAVDVAGIPLQSVLTIEEQIDDPTERIAALLGYYKKQTGETFPEDTATQIFRVCRAIMGKWTGPDRTLLRSARTTIEGMRLGVIIQAMADGMRGDGCGYGKLTSIDPKTGARKISGHLTVFRHGQPLFGGGENPIQSYLPGQVEHVSALLDNLRLHFHDPQQIEFAYDGTQIWLLDSMSADRSVSGAIRAAVELVEDGLITEEEALCHVDASSLGRVLHPQVKPGSLHNKVIATGIPASPGAAAGKIAFSSRAAERFVAAGKDCILVRAETGPEDFKAMHSAQGVLTGRGGLTSHAAVVARGLGVPCVVGASDIQISVVDHDSASPQTRLLKTPLGEQQELQEGDIITVDGTTGNVLRGKADLVEPSLDQYFESFLSWADKVRDIGVQANADTIDEVRAAKKFKADGIGLCRTEHMYFEESQLAVMRHMLFAESSEERKLVLQQLIQMQKRDFTAIFSEMPGRNVCIRLFDPPLHEFLPRARGEIERLANDLGRHVRHVFQRADELKEFNPMLGLRGVRIGVVMPEIYEMQACAIFEAAVEVRRKGMDIIPEIMIPLVSANRELELVRDHVNEVADMVTRESQVELKYRLGVMVETPRAALRSGDLAQNSDFLSFGTNDLTQMTYGLSRDDSQRFMEEYISQQVYPSDPFSTLDKEGVGELLKMAADRAREVKSDLTLSICGEHGGDPESIMFCRKMGFNYVSCSPYRVPIARLAAAQCVIADD